MYVMSRPRLLAFIAENATFVLLTIPTCVIVYENIGSKYRLELPSTILACLSIVVIIPIYVFYFKGEWFRNRSKFAQQLNLGRKGDVDRRRSTAVALRNASMMGGGGEKEKQQQQQGSTTRQRTPGSDGVRHVEQV